MLDANQGRRALVGGSGWAPALLDYGGEVDSDVGDEGLRHRHAHALFRPQGVGKPDLLVTHTARPAPRWYRSSGTVAARAG